MTRPRLLLLAGFMLMLVLVGAGGGIYWYLFGANTLDSAELVPANTILFASIPNAVTLLEGYETSQAKVIASSQNMKPLHEALVNLIGQKNVDLFHDFLPNLSGQSFIAVTHFDYDHPEKVGLIAAMKPKAGLGDFGTFLDKAKATWPEILKQGKTGTGTVSGVAYQWIQGPGAPDKICVAQIGGWIVTSWGEASLQDWIERYQGKSSTSSLAKDVNYVNVLARVGEEPMTLLYLNYHGVVKILQKQMAKTNPAAGDYLARKLESLGGAAVATRFENGEIVDRFFLVFPRSAQAASGMGVAACPFETLKFTGPDTRFYWASTINWKQYVKNLREQARPSASDQVNPMAGAGLTFLQNWSRSAGVDGERNIVNALGPEVSLQVEWPADSPWPEAGLFVKLDKPDDFKPTVTAIVDSVRQAFAKTAVVQEVAVGDQHFAALKFVQTSPFSPTITEDGPYLGVFMTENQAVRSFQREPSIGLMHNANFSRQLGDKRNGAEQILFLDSPYLVDRAYRTAMPYLSIAEMFNKNLAAMLNGKELPADLAWLAPIGTWSCVVTPDEEGIQGYSVSGIGNQGIFLASALGGTAGVLQTMGVLPRTIAGPGLPLGAPPPAPPDPSAPTTVTTTAGAVVSITSAGKILFDDTPVPNDQIGDFLKAKKAANPALKLSVKVDRNASPDTLSRVMDAGASAGFGVLPYSVTSGASPLPPATNDAPPISAPAPSTNAVPLPDTNSDDTPTTPAPLQPQQ